MNLLNDMKNLYMNVQITRSHSVKCLNYSERAKPIQIEIMFDIILVGTFRGSLEMFMDMSTAAFVVVASVLLVYFVLNAFVFRTWNYFTKRGIVFDRGVPILGTFASVMLRREPMVMAIERIYNQYSAHKFIGVYQMGGRPVYLVNDPELIKAITIKDFDHFVNRSFQIDEKIDPIFGRNLFNMTDERWRDMRSILSPLFTGSKMRGMLTLMNNSIDEFVAEISEQLATAGAAGHEYPLMQIYSSTATDVIASCAFGLRINSLREPDNEFYTMSNQVAYAFQSPKMFMNSCFPKLSKWLRLNILRPQETKFFRDIVNRNVKQRKEDGIVRNDLLHLMTLTSEGRLDSIAESDLDQDAGFATVHEMLSIKSTEKLKSKF